MSRLPQLKQATQRLHLTLGWLVLLVGLLLAALPLSAQSNLAPVPVLTGPVIDTTGTLDRATVQGLTQQALDLQKRKGSQLQVLVIPTTQPEDIAQYSVRAFEQYKIGREKVDDGLLLVVAKDDRRVHIEVGYGLEGAIPDATASRVIQEYLVPKFRAGDFGGGITDATQTLVKLVDGEALPAPMVEERENRGGSDWSSALFMALFAAIFINVFFRWVPKLLRLPASLAVPAFLAFSASQMIALLFVGGLIGLVVFLTTLGGGQYARSRNWGNFPPGGGGWGGGGFGGGGFGGGGGGGFGGGGGWGGGGGSSGGGGASGSW